MQKVLLGGLLSLLMATTAMAADMAARPYQKAPPMAAPIPYSWTGFYVGGHVGGTFRDDNGFGSDGNGRFIGGGQIGFDYQFSGSWVFGVEAQYSYVDSNNNGTPFVFPGGTFGNNLRGLGSVTGRLGYAWGPALLYVKGGYGYADRRNFGTGAFTFNNGRDGYTVGGGMEYMFAQNWSGKIEYQYFHFDNNQLFVGAPLVGLGNFRDEEHTIKAGLNYHFNFAGMGSRY